MNDRQISEIKEMVWINAHQKILGFKRSSKTSPNQSTAKFSVKLNNVDLKLINSEQHLTTKDIEPFKYFFNNIFDWSNVVRSIMNSVEDFDESNFEGLTGADDFRDMVEDDLTELLHSPQGVGFICTLQPVEMRNYFLEALEQALEEDRGQREGEEAVSTERVFERCWEILNLWAEEHNDIDIDILTPGIDVSVEDCNEERRKVLKVSMEKRGDIDFDLLIDFVIEKKRDSRSLVTLAAETIADFVSEEEDVKLLEMPHTLRAFVGKKCADMMFFRECFC